MYQNRLEQNELIVFGPVPSRRLGHSLGINNIPPKICSYSCVYCQLGRTIKMQTEPQVFYKPEEILHITENKVNEVTGAGETIDYLTFVPDGEPTLDTNLGREIDLLKSLGIPIAVITGSSLIWRREVREALMGADLVSLKVDTVEEEVWHKINRPHRNLKLSSILDGSQEFAHSFQGKLITETMLLANINDSDQHLRRVAEFLSLLKPIVAYLSIPTRPPAEQWAYPPDENVINRAYHILNEKIEKVEYLIEYEGDDFALTSNVEKDILSTTSVHPMRESALDAFLERAGEDWAIVHRLIAQGKLSEVKYGKHKFYLRKFRKWHKR